MTVQDMIELLERQDPKAEVLVTGSGLCKPATVGLLNGWRDKVLISPSS